MKLNIKNRMEELNITRYELAQKIGVTYPTIDKDRLKFKIGKLSNEDTIRVMEAVKVSLGVM